MIKQFEPMNYRQLNMRMNYHDEALHDKFFLVRDVFKYPIVITEDNGLWSYFPLHKYTLAVKQDDVYINDARHAFINDEKTAKEFIDNIKRLNKLAIKIII